MGLWTRLKRLFGFGAPNEQTDAASEGAETVEDSPGSCTVCGTGVDPGQEQCPLCGSHDIVFDGADAGDEAADGPSPKTTRSAGDDDAVARLKQLRQQDEE